MLKVFVRGIDEIPKDKEVISDCDLIYSLTLVEPTDEVKNIIKSIDKAEFNGGTTVIDRFGTTIPISELSSGSKTGVVAALYPDKIIDTIDCGYNAIDALLTFVKDGNLIIPDPIVFDRFNDATGDPNHRVSIYYNGYVFGSVERLSIYLTTESPDEPDLSIPGVKRG